MKNHSIRLLLLALFTIIPANLPAENEKSLPKAADLDNFKSIVGHWRGEGLGGVCEETWLPESAACMLGTFKFMKNGQLNFIEIMTLSIDSMGPAVRVKHFNADMTAWEDKAEMVTFRYDSSSANQHFFSGLRFTRPSDDSLQIGATFKNPDGSTLEEMFNFKRVNF